MEIPTPKFAGSGTLGDGGPPYIVYSVSPKVDQDAEYWIKYDPELIQPGTPLLCNGTQTYTAVMNPKGGRMDGPIAKKLADYVLMDIQTEGGSNYLVFARNTLPSAQYYANPSDQWTIRKTWEFPAMMLAFPNSAPNFYPDIDSGNLVNVTVKPTVIPRFTGPCTVLVRQYWTSQYWTQAQMEAEVPMVPQEISWDYKGLASGSGMFLSPEIITPPLGIITAIRGQVVPSTTVQQQTYPPTSTPTWVNDVEDDDQKRIRGRVFREQRLVLIPFDPRRTRQPRITSS